MGNKDKKEVTSKAVKETPSKAVKETPSKAVKETNQKGMTNYDKKLQKKKEQEAKVKRSKKITQIACVVVLLAVITGVSAYFIIRHNYAYGEYIAVDDEKITGIEFDYYYYTTANKYISTYSDYLTYVGLDKTKSYADQDYTDDMTWKDYFSKGAVDMIKQTKALIADAKDHNFNYDVTDDYKTYMEGFNKTASESGKSTDKYFKITFGDFASESSLKSIIEEYLMASAYYAKLQKDNTPSASAIAAYHEANKDTYDSVDYRILPVATKAAADEMASKITDEASFGTLCKTYAAADKKATYESGDASLVKNGKLSTLSKVYGSWLFDASRKPGDVTVAEDTANNVVYVVYFDSRYYDAGTNDSTISKAIIDQAVTAYVNKLVADATVTDKHNHLKYLSLPAEEASK